MDKLKYILNRYRKIILHKRHRFNFFLLFIFPFLSACALGSVYTLPTMEIKNPNTKQNAILILGLELSSYDLYSATVSINMNGRIQEAYGNLLKGKIPDDSQNKNSGPQAFNYTRGGDHGYLVFEFPMNFDDKISVHCLTYLLSVAFRRVEVPPKTPKSIEIQNSLGQWKFYKDIGFDLKPGLRNVHPLGYKNDPNWTFYGCKFNLEKPGIYYLGELKLNLGLSIGVNIPDGNIATQQILVAPDIKNHTAALNGTISAYSDTNKFKQFLILNKVNEDIFFDYSKYWRQISQEEYLNFGK